MEYLFRESTRGIQSDVCTCFLACCSLVVLCVGVNTGIAQIPAFSGAEGPGATATGGRGGNVYHVTNLEFDKDGVIPGSLKYGMNTAPAGGRTIVFDVGGTIYHEGGGAGWWFRCGTDNLSIAGQTAPGGITIAGVGTKFTGNNNILRNITVRPNKDPVHLDYFTYDALALQVTNSIVDHVKDGSGRIINDLTSGTQATEWATVLAERPNALGNAPYNRPAGFNTDQDGMPDPWEQRHGLNPAVANNNGDFDADGYTDLEEYINELAEWPAPQPKCPTAFTFIATRRFDDHEYHELNESSKIFVRTRCSTPAAWSRKTPSTLCHG